MVKTVGVAGLGLIGGSMAKAIRKYTDCTLLGYNRNSATLSRALDEGVIDGVLTEERLAECELVIIALYPEATVEYVTKHRDHFRKGGIVMDCGGVKGVVCGPLESVVKDAGFWFIGGHPTEVPGRHLGVRPEAGLRPPPALHAGGARPHHRVHLPAGPGGELRLCGQPVGP